MQELIGANSEAIENAEDREKLQTVMKFTLKKKKFKIF